MANISKEIQKSLDKISDSLDLVIACKKNGEDAINVFAAPTMDAYFFEKSIKEAKCVKNTTPEDFPAVAKAIEQEYGCNILDEISKGACFMYVEEEDQECWYFAR